jgi:retron-type reverse transcriptase
MGNVPPQIEDKDAVILLQSARSREFGITYGNIVPRNCFRTGLLRSGDGVVIVRSKIGRTTVHLLKTKFFSSKAGMNNARRGSEDKSCLVDEEIDINIKSISNIKNLVTAYELIKSKPGNMTPAIEETTLDGLDLNYLKNVEKQLRAGTFKFGPTRRINMTKPGSDKTRSLTIVSPREKIVQKAIQLVMEPKFEAEFLDSSHGFRPRRGTYTAVKYLDSNFQSSSFIIEADFTQAFPSISHDILLRLLKKKIKCEKTLSLIKSDLKAGYVELGTLHEAQIMGTPQGSILSPLLCNIFLHELDKFIVSLKKEFEVGTKRKKSKEYTRLENKLKY